MQSTFILPASSSPPPLDHDRHPAGNPNVLSPIASPSINTSPIQNRRPASHRQPLTISTRTQPLNSSFSPSSSPSFSPSSFRSLGIHSAGRTRTTARLTKFSSRSPGTPASRRSSAASVKGYGLSPALTDVRRRSASSSVNKSPAGRPRTPLPMSSYASIAQTRPITPEIVVLYDEESYMDRRAARNSECCLSLGIVDSFSPPFTVNLWPSPPCSPNPSPTTTLFPPIVLSQSGHHRSRYNGSDASVDSLEKTYCGQRYQTTASVSRSKYQSWSSKRAPKETKEERARRKAAEERRKRTEADRPLPYSKKLEIDEFFGDVPAKERKSKRRTTMMTTMTASTKNSTTWSSKQAYRNVGGGSQVDHVSQDGTVWLDVEEEQEWAWLISESEKHGQALPSWPQTFTSHLFTTKTESGASVNDPASPPISPLSTTFERPSINPVKRTARKTHSRSFSQSFTSLADPFRKDDDWHTSERTKPNSSPALFVKMFFSDPVGTKNEKTQSRFHSQACSRSNSGSGSTVSDERTKRCKNRPNGSKSSSSYSSSSTSASLSVKPIPGEIHATNKHIQEPSSLPIVRTPTSTSTSTTSTASSTTSTASSTTSTSTLASSQKKVGQITPSDQSDLKKSLSINILDLRLADEVQVQNGGGDDDSDEHLGLGNETKDEKQVPASKRVARFNGTHKKSGFRSALKGFLKPKGGTNSA